MPTTRRCTDITKPVTQSKRVGRTNAERVTKALCPVAATASVLQALLIAVCISGGWIRLLLQTRSNKLVLLRMYNATSLQMTLQRLGDDLP